MESVGTIVMKREVDLFLRARRFKRCKFNLTPNVDNAHGLEQTMVIYEYPEPWTEEVKHDSVNTFFVKNTGQSRVLIMEQNMT